MSYREMRNFTEMMRSLGYNRLISMENFRSPNFQLIADILHWLVSRYDQNADISSSRNIDTEQDRVIFIKMVAHFMMTRAHVKLNTKRLYQADGYAVRELLKVTTLLYNSMMQSRLDEEDNQTDSSSFNDIFDTNKLKEIKETRMLASQLIDKGAVLSDMLKREVDLREERHTSLNNQLETAQVEKAISSSIHSVEQEKIKQESALNNISTDESTLDAKIEKKKQELERNQKRLNTLQAVRPAYMDEYEQLEQELNSLYSDYLVTFKNLAWLENQYEDLVHQQRNRMACAGSIEDGEMTLKKMADQLRKSESSDWATNETGQTKQIKNSRKPANDDFDELLEDEIEDDDDEAHVGGGKLDTGKVFGVGKLESKKNFGSMGGDVEEDEDDDEDDEDDDEDDDDEDDEDDDEDDDDSLTTPIDDNDSDELEQNSDGLGNDLSRVKGSRGDPRYSTNMAGGDNLLSNQNGSMGGRPRGAEYNNRNSKSRRRTNQQPIAGDAGDDF